MTKTIDRRSDSQRLLTDGLNVGAALLAAGFLCLAFTTEANAVAIEGDDAMVPLALGHDRKRVRVKKTKLGSYRTVNAVALARCPAGRRKSIYVMRVEFKPKGKLFVPDLTMWVHTGRGQAGGYYAQAYDWSGQPLE
ncbi:MAG: hypothetical protein M9921_13050 [Fimbriimonadaceae bacterium]|nr:hypothetical protein [Fimbriimonadaceae bacterium]